MAARKNTAKSKTSNAKPARKAAKPERPIVLVNDPNRPKPVWDGTQLILGNVVLATFTQRAGQQIAVLDAFQKAGWPVKIPWVRTGDTLKVLARIHSLVSRLNDSLGRRGIDFHADGLGITWKKV